ncbi:UNVERIFIED_CONTAM: putative membrane protein [Brevibacillus sp. OAP136]
MRALVREILLFMIVVSSIIGAVVFYNELPDTMATHFGIENEVNGTSSKQTTILIFALLGFVPFLLPFAKRMSGQKSNDAKFAFSIQVSRFCIALILAIAEWTILLYNLGYTMDIRRIVFIAIGILFLVTGNYLGISKPNYFMGFRTPWALLDEENWRKTHRMGGPLMMVGGLVILVSTFLPTYLSIIIFFATLVCIVLVPFIYSYMIFKRRRS